MINDRAGRKTYLLLADRLNTAERSAVVIQFTINGEASITPHFERIPVDLPQWRQGSVNTSVKFRRSSSKMFAGLPK